MSMFDRLFGKVRDVPPEIAEQEEIIQAAQESLRLLQDKLAQDPCAADPTREECAPEVKHLIHRRPDVAAVISSSRDAWRVRP